MGIVRDMGDLQREIDKSRKLAYNILIKTASKGSQGSPSWQDICLRRSRLFFTREQGGYFLSLSFLTNVIIAHIIITKVNISLYVTMLSSPFPKTQSG